MWLVVGGAYAGKRRVVQERIKNPYWVSAYQGDDWKEWQNSWHEKKIMNPSIVFEGWEQWIWQELDRHSAGGSTKVDSIRARMKQFFDHALHIEETEQKQVTLIMLEMGKGIVPLQKEERVWRDLAGWVLQDAAEKATEVMYVWNGLGQKIK